MTLPDLQQCPECDHPHVHRAETLILRRHDDLPNGEAPDDEPSDDEPPDDGSPDRTPRDGVPHLLVRFGDSLKYIGEQIIGPGIKWVIDMIERIIRWGPWTITIHPPDIPEPQPPEQKRNTKKLKKTKSTERPKLSPEERKKLEKQEAKKRRRREKKRRGF